MNKGKVDVLLGLQWGDEGKGKVVDVLTPKYDVVARFQGGPNAGHTLEFEGQKYVLRSIPSGIFQGDKVNIIGNGVVLAPDLFMDEAKALEASGHELRSRLHISKKAHLIMPTHRVLDAAYEAQKGKDKVGTTGKGIGPTYTDKVSRNGLRVGDILENFEEKYAKAKARHLNIINSIASNLDEEQRFALNNQLTTLHKVEKKWLEGVEYLRQFPIVDSEHELNNLLKSDKSVLCEGAQGTMLDVDFGSYPFVTSSNTICAGACTGLGIGPNKIGEVYGIMKAYCTRVGAGPFPTELFDETGKTIRDLGHEYGAVTGRERRCGWIDLVALRYSIMVNGVTQLIMMKSDVLDGFDTIKACVAYKQNGTQIDYFPYNIEEGIEPVYEELPGWKTDMTKFTSEDQFPKEFSDYIAFLEKQLMAKRNYIFDTIKQVYQLYGFQQIETPAMETLGTLMGKYGEEGDKLLFKVLNSGDYLSKISDDELKERNTLHLAAKLCEKGLRYDLTVPFARYVVMHREELQLPFKRYQMQPVWRADRPQKGRYREFWQFDGDIVGSDSLLNEVELMQIVDTVFSRFGVRIQIKINNRKILTGIAEIIGAADKIVDITVAIDKLDKIGLDNVNEELRGDGLTEEQIAKLQPIISLEGTNDEKLDTIAEVLKDSETGLKGVEECRFILDTLKSLGLKNEIQLDLTLARGLNYYTGAIFEVKALDVQIGSITGGGRYDNLTGIFGMPGISGVGISFGVDRIFDVLNALDCYPKDAVNGTQLLFINFGEKETAYCLPFVAQARAAGIRTEIFPDSSKMKKQMSYANAKQIPFVALAGENEMAAQKLTLKNMLTGEQQLVDISEIIKTVLA